MLSVPSKKDSTPDQQISTQEGTTSGQKTDGQDYHFKDNESFEVEPFLCCPPEGNQLANPLLTKNADDSMFDLSESQDEDKEDSSEKVTLTRMAKVFCK